MKKLISILFLFTIGTYTFSQNNWPSSGDALLSNSFNGRTNQTIINEDPGNQAVADIRISTGISKSFTVMKFGANFNEYTFGGQSLADMARFRSDSGVKGLIFTTGGAWPLIFGTTDQERMRITSSGNVGIGTANPGAKLSVNGRIESTEVQVKATIADYVFAEGYPLISLEALEEFIKKNKHLPNVYSEKDYNENNGNIPLGEVTMSLLEKIEELTLHIIELNKRIKELEFKK